MRGREMKKIMKICRIMKATHIARAENSVIHQNLP